MLVFLLFFVVVVATAAVVAADCPVVVLVVAVVTAVGAVFKVVDTFFRVPNLHPDATAPVISLKGRSLLPYCHFELDHSDYITGGRRNPELPGPEGAHPGIMLSPNTKVIEFQSCGGKVKVSK